MNVASNELRVTNYVIDKIGLVVLIIIHSLILDGVLHVIPENGSPILGIYFFVLYFSYHFLFEYFLGKTPGKIFTKTKVVNLYGEKASTKSLIIRNICRLIPLDNFSFILSDKGWHDSISKTTVVSK
jgi:uncharacterized RDD family membrane protein YckC